MGEFPVGRACAQRAGRWRAKVAAVLLTLFASLGGCGSVGRSAGSQDSHAPAQGVLLTGQNSFAEIESNDGFSQANIVPSNGAALIRIDGEVASSVDVDVFDLGPVAGRSRLHVELSADSEIRGPVALFGPTHDLLVVDDAQDFIAGLGGTFADAEISAPQSHMFVAVASDGELRGRYTLVIERSSAAAPRPSRPQTAYLNFEGAQRVQIGGRAPIGFGAFDPGDVLAELEGRRDDFIEAVTAKVAFDFAGLNVTILNSNHAKGTPTANSSRLGTPKPAGAFATIHIGGRDGALIGLADSVDEYNTDPGQQAIVYADGFDGLAPFRPTLDEAAQAMANVISHELGHLLGLVHTSDARSIMVQSATWAEAVRDRSFGRFPLDRSVFPVGFEDSVQKLVANVGSAGRSPTSPAPTPAPVSPAPLPTATPAVVVSDSGTLSVGVTAAEARAVQSELCLCLCARCLEATGE